VRGDLDHGEDSAPGTRYASFTLSRHSITSVAASPVSCRISFLWDSSASASISLLINLSESNFPALSPFTLGRESKRSSVVSRRERIRGYYSDIRGQIGHARDDLPEVEGEDIIRGVDKKTLRSRVGKGQDPDYGYQHSSTAILVVRRRVCSSTAKSSPGAFYANLLVPSTAT